jgi:ectoine hydroxylase-related dioxygenase (phytanoyl-CoA dioxygenase family)
MNPRDGAPIRMPTPDEVAAFWADGAIVLRGVLAPEFVAAMTPHVAALLDEPEIADMTAMGADLARAGERVLRDPEGDARGRFRSGVDHWVAHSAFARFACESGVPAIAAVLLRATKLNLWEDSVLVKEPGAGERTAWHQDLSYFHVRGEQLCTTWIPLDPVDAETGAMSFVRGSHRWPNVYRPNLFVSPMSIPGTDGDEVPDVDALAARGEVELLRWDLAPGDVSVHHARTLHAAGANRSTSRWRRAISIRYCGDDVRYCFRPGAPRKPHHREMADGDILDHERCPVVWRA